MATPITVPPSSASSQSSPDVSPHLSSASAKNAIYNTKQGRPWPVIVSQIALLIMRISSIIVLGLGIAFLASNPMLGWSLLIAAITLAISSLLCAIAISVYQTLTIRKLQSEVSSLERQSGVIFIEEGVEDALLSFESPFAGLEDDLVSPISPPLSPGDRSYIDHLVMQAEARSLEERC